MKTLWFQCKAVSKRLPLTDSRWHQCASFPSSLFCLALAGTLSKVCLAATCSEHSIKADAAARPVHDLHPTILLCGSAPAAGWLAVTHCQCSNSHINDTNQKIITTQALQPDLCDGTIPPSSASRSRCGPGRAGSWWELTTVCSWWNYGASRETSASRPDGESWRVWPNSFSNHPRHTSKTLIITWPSCKGRIFSDCLCWAHHEPITKLLLSSYKWPQTLHNTVRQCLCTLKSS